jgi:hypothetical protein
LGVTPCRSTGNRQAVYGQGIKAGGVLTAKEGNGVKVIVASKTTDEGLKAFSGTVNCNFWETGDVTAEIEVVLMAAFGEHYQKYTVFNIFPFDQLSSGLTPPALISLIYSCNSIGNNLNIMFHESDDGSLVLGRQGCENLDSKKFVPRRSHLISQSEYEIFTEPQSAGF